MSSEVPQPIDLNISGQSFSFRVHQRMVEMAPAKPIMWYWFDLRGLHHRGGDVNVRASIDAWWAQTRQQQLTGEDLLDAETNLVLAELFPFVAADRGPQRVFRDAFLRPEPKWIRTRRHAARRASEDGSLDPGGDALDRTVILDDLVWSRLQATAARRDLAAISQELRALLIGEMPNEGRRPALTEACRRWVGNGVVALRRGGQQQLRDFVRRGVLRWMKSYRRRGGQSDVRLFVNMLAVEAKLAFYICYRNAWAKLIHHLVTHRSLDSQSALFMTLWHDVRDQDENCADPFWGLVPALHPLSERVMTQGNHRYLIGKWLLAAGRKSAQAFTCAEFWDVRATILAAGHEYRHLHQRQEDARGCALIANSTAVESMTNPSANAYGTLFAEYAATECISCPICGGPVFFVDALPADDGCDVRFKCERSHSDVIRISRKDVA